MNEIVPDYLQSLNPEQQQAALSTEGPLLILAGAGAGKTKTITLRILHLIKRGVRPEDILAITFTNKAAKEMRERVFSLINGDAHLNLPVSTYASGFGKPFVSTFHSLAVHILKESGSHVGVGRNFVIYDRGDSRQRVKDALVELGHDPKQIEPSKILSAISREKGNFTSQEEYEAKNADDYMGGIIAEVWKRYDRALEKEKALDFDDLLFKATHLLAIHREVREYYQKKWKYVHVDEYQDTNQVQYKLIQLLCATHQNLAVVGDTDQCVLPQTKIRTRDIQTKKERVKKIEDVSKEDEVLSSGGNGGVCWQKVTSIKKTAYKGDIVSIKTVSGKKLEMTQNHVIFSSLPNRADIYFTYLMYSSQLGFRIGVAHGTRQSRPNEFTTGLQVRSRQEKADRIWVLKISATKSEALFAEQYFSTYYGLPRMVFHTTGRKLLLTNKQIATLFSIINTRERAEKLFADTGMHFDFPHYWPQGTTLTNTTKKRMNVRLVLFGDRRKTIRSPWGATRVSINTTSGEVREKLQSLGFTTRKGKRQDWRCEIHNLDYGKAEKVAHTMTSSIDNLMLVRHAQITKGKSMLFHIAANLHPYMSVATLDINRGVVEDEIVAVERKAYDGFVYDINVENTHNYMANDICVHNCIYGWRGADIKNILQFENDYPSAKVVLLEQNYRSTQTILSAANKVIEKNIYRKKKNLFTKNAEGDKIKIYTAFDENDEANFVANSVRDLVGEGTPADQIAILFRANFQSRALEDAFLRRNIPYALLGTKFFERREVKDVLSYIRAALNPDSMADTKRIINTPTRGIGKTTLLKVLEGREHELPQAARFKVAEFRYILASIRTKAGTEKTSEVVRHAIIVSGIEKALKEEKDDQERLENVRELVTLAIKYDDMPIPEGIEKLLEEAALASDQDSLDIDQKKEEDKGPSVKLMTVHASKGLEFDYVFITGMEQDLFPHSRSSDGSGPPEQSEEERRLFYVALTRARKRLFLSHSNVRTIFGSRQVNLPSEFLADIDVELIEKEEPVSGIKSIFIDF